MWSGIEMDVGIYNIMLRIYNNNDHAIVPSEFLEQMKAKDIYPNMVYYNGQYNAITIIIILPGHL